MSYYLHMRRQHSKRRAGVGERPRTGGLKPAIGMLVCLLILGACGSAPAQTATTDRFLITFDPGRPLAGANTTFTVTLADRNGTPANADAVIVAPLMRPMSHAEPEVALQPAGTGRWQAAGQFLTMSGGWELVVRVSAAGQDDEATFMVAVP